MAEDPRRNKGANAEWHADRLRLVRSMSQSRLLAPLHVTPRHNGGVPEVVESPLDVRSVDPEHTTRDDRPWIVLVWNDPINLMTYVTHVFQEYFGYDRSKAEALMLDVHHRGRAVVSNDEWAGHCGNADTGDGYSAGRDLDHTQAFVQNDIKAWLTNRLRADGFTGLRFDFAKGYGARRDDDDLVSFLQQFCNISTEFFEPNFAQLTIFNQQR